MLVHTETESREVMKMGDAVGPHKLGDPVAEAWPTARAATRLGKDGRWRKAGAVLVAAGLVTLPFLVFFISRQESVSRAWQSAAATLTMMTGGTSSTVLTSMSQFFLSRNSPCRFLGSV